MTKYCFRENLLLTAEDTTQILAYLHDGKPKLYHPGTISHATSIFKIILSKPDKADAQGRG
jgi:hypothetical protein